MTNAFKQRALAYVAEHGLHAGTHPENVVAMRLHRAGHRYFDQQFRVGRYRLDFAWAHLAIALEVDGPHHHRPDIAHKDALRDAWLRDQGWIVLRINTSDTMDKQTARVSELVHALGWRRG